MAILKHIASRNADYSGIIEYFMFQHDELTKKPILDEAGRMLLRDEYYIDGINCDATSFDKECERLNELYHKNNSFSEIKSHHYIISFDPNDVAEHGLTGEKAQALGMEYAAKNFPGHQALVATHTDGHNGSGNIHVHIAINSLRKNDTAPQDFAERPCDIKAGYKHHLTNNYLIYLKKSLMELCEREHLNQVDLLSPAEKKITEREYWLQRKEQQKLDQKNEEIISAGLKPRQTKFQTEKDYLRSAIEEVSDHAKSLDEFILELKEKYNITLTDKRGRFSYLHPDREKNITERALGTHYSKEYIRQLINENEKKHPIINAPTPVIDTPKTEQSSDPYAIFYVQSNLRLVVELQNHVKASQSRAYERKVKISNLQEMAKTIAYVQEHDYDSRDSLQLGYDDITEKYSQARQSIKETETQIKAVNEQIHYTGQYLSTKKVYARFLNSKQKMKFQQEYSNEISQYKESRDWLKSKYPDGKIPSIDSLKAERERLQIKKSSQYETYNYFKDYQKELRTVCKNVDSILGHESERSQDKSHSRD